MGILRKFLKHAGRGYFPALCWMATGFLVLFYVLGIVKFGYVGIEERTYSGRIVDRHVGGPRAVKSSGVALVARLAIQMAEGTPSQVTVQLDGRTPIYLDNFIDSLSRLNVGDQVKVECLEVAGEDSGYWRSCRPWWVAKSSGELIFDISRDKLRSELIEAFSPGYGAWAVLYFLLFVFAVFDIFFFSKNLSKG